MKVQDKIKNLFQVDKIILVIFILLSAFGLVMIYSASSYFSLTSVGNSEYFLIRQFAFVVAGIAIAIGIANNGKKFFFNERILQIVYVILILLLLFVFTQSGIKGAKSWINLRIFNLQPSEFAKVILIWASAFYYQKFKDNRDWKQLYMYPMGMLLLVSILVLMQPDFGTAFVFILVIGSMLFVAGISLRLVVYTLLAAVASLPAFYFSLSPYQKNRILNFLHPERDITNTGYQAVQGKIAAGSGKFIGRGLFKGPQNQFNFIPEKQTDYIFPVFVEEMGFVGGTILIGLYTIMLYRFVKLSKKTANKFNQMLIIGICAMFLAHIFENIGMTIGLMPITGIPLPFLSYGGTFQLVNLIAMGIVLSISCEKTPLDFM